MIATILYSHYVNYREDCRIGQIFWELHQTVESVKNIYLPLGGGSGYVPPPLATSEDDYDETGKSYQKFGDGTRKNIELERLKPDNTKSSKTTESAPGKTWSSAYSSDSSLKKKLIMTASDDSVNQSKSDFDFDQFRISQTELDSIRQVYQQAEYAPFITRNRVSSQFGGQRGRFS